RTGGDPAALHVLDGAVHSEHLQQQLERAATHIDPCLERRGGQRPVRLCERGEDLRGGLLRGHGRGREVLPDSPVLLAGQQQHVRPVRRTSRTPHLLVVGDGGG